MVWLTIPAVITTSTTASSVLYPFALSTSVSAIHPMFWPTGTSLFYHSIPTWSLIPMTNGSVYPTLTQPVGALPRPLARPALLRGRRALRKSIDLFRMLRPDDEVRRFLSGEPITIQGHRFDYRIQKRHNLLHHTLSPDSPHIPYQLNLIDKTSGQKLAQGCIIVPDTPVIDQVIALILHAQDATEELVVLNRTNWTPRLAPTLLARAA